MKFSKQDLGFILYNNRSKTVVQNFMPKNINPYRLTNIEHIFEESKKLFISNNKMVEIPISDLNLNSNDIIVTRNDINNLSQEFIDNIGKFSDKELEFIKKRGINREIIEKWKLLGLSNFKDINKLKIIGATVHPLTSNVLEDAIEDGGIIFPLFNNNILENCAIRKIALEKSSLKYTLACPDVPIWKSDGILPGNEIWLTEGLFDMFSLDSIGYKSVSCSSAMWSGLQLYELIMLKPSKINIFSDSDEVGLRTSAILKHFFISYGIESEIFKSKVTKDASEHFFELYLTISDIEKIDINPDDIIKSDDSFDFLKYLKNRKY